MAEGGIDVSDKQKAYRAVSGIASTVGAFFILGPWGLPLVGGALLTTTLGRSAEVRRAGRWMSQHVPDRLRGPAAGFSALAGDTVEFGRRSLSAGTNPKVGLTVAAVAGVMFAVPLIPLFVPTLAGAAVAGLTAAIAGPVTLGVAAAAVHHFRAVKRFAARQKAKSGADLDTNSLAAMTVSDHFNAEMSDAVAAGRQMGRGVRRVARAVKFWRDAAEHLAFRLGKPVVALGVKLGRGAAHLGGVALRGVGRGIVYAGTSFSREHRRVRAENLALKAENAAGQAAIDGLTSQVNELTKENSAMRRAVRRIEVGAKMVVLQPAVARSPKTVAAPKAARIVVEGRTARGKTAQVQQRQKGAGRQL